MDDENDSFSYLEDQYNTNATGEESHKYKQEVHYDPKYLPVKGQTWESYLQDLKVHIRYATNANTDNHINGTRGAWYTHRRSRECWMCQDLNIMHSMLRTIERMIKTSPKKTFQ